MPMHVINLEEHIETLSHILPIILNIWEPRMYYKSYFSLSLSYNNSKSWTNFKYIFELNNASVYEPPFKAAIWHSFVKIKIFSSSTYFVSIDFNMFKIIWLKLG